MKIAVVDYPTWQSFVNIGKGFLSEPRRRQAQNDRSDNLTHRSRAKKWGLLAVSALLCV